MATTGKYSRKREAVLNCLRSTTTHPSADWVYQQLKQEYPDMSLGTVYRNLSQCKQRGEIISVGFVGGFERFDARVTPHEHLICRDCGSVEDIFDLKLPHDLDQQVMKKTGAQIDTHAFVFYGRCANCCQSEENAG